MTKLIKKEDKVAIYSMLVAVSVMISMYVLSFFELEGYKDVFYYMSSIIIFLSAVICYTFFGYNRTKEGKVMCLLVFIFAACTVIERLLSASIFIVGKPEAIVYPIFAIFYLFLLSYMYPEKAIMKKPVSFIIAIMMIVLFELTLALDTSIYHAILLGCFQLLIGGLCVTNIIKKNKIGYNVIIAIINIIGIVYAVALLFGADFVDVMKKVVANTQILLIEFMLFYHFFSKNNNSEDII